MSGTAQEIKLSDEFRQKLDWHLSRYPDRRAALLPALHLAQKQFGWLSNEVMDHVAGLLQLPPVDVYEVATFYTLYNKKPVGKHCIWACTSVSCFLRGSDELLAHLKTKLGVEVGGTTADGQFTLFEVECLANCANAPAIQVDADYHDRVTNDAADKLLESLC
jgi:NADH-quinone oxidoreductase subunit E